MDLSRVIILFCLAIFSAPIGALELNGTYEENTDGSYTIDADDGYHEFYGFADEETDETLDVSMKDIHGNYLDGKARLELNGDYRLELTNNKNGQPVNGDISPKSE